MMDSKLSLPSTTSFLLAVALLILHSSSSHAFNITQILSQYPDLSAFSDALTRTQVASQINSRQTLTVLAVSNGAMSGLPSPQDTQAAVLSLHVILDYFDPQKLQGIPDKSTTLTTLYQSSGLAKGMQGFLNVSVTNGGVEFGSAVPGSSFVSSLVKSIVAQPYNISVLQVSSLVVPPNLHTNPTASSQSQGATTSASSSAPGTTPATPTTNAPATGPPNTAGTPPSAAGGSTAPSAGGGTTPSSAGGGTTPSSVGGGTTPPSAGGGTTPYSAGGGTIPSSATGATPPSAGGGKIPSSAAGATPPSAGGGTPASSAAGAAPPSSAGTKTPSVSGAIPPSGSSAAAPSDSGTSSTVVANATADSPAGTTNPTGPADVPAVSTPLPTAAGPVADSPLADTPAGGTSGGKRYHYSLNHVILQIMSFILIRSLARTT